MAGDQRGLALSGLPGCWTPGIWRAQKQLLFSPAAEREPGCWLKVRVTLTDLSQAQGWPCFPFSRNRKQNLSLWAQAEPGGGEGCKGHCLDAHTAIWDQEVKKFPLLGEDRMDQGSTPAQRPGSIPAGARRVLVGFVEGLQCSVNVDGEKFTPLL